MKLIRTIISAPLITLGIFLFFLGSAIMMGFKDAFQIVTIVKTALEMSEDIMLGKVQKLREELTKILND